MVKIGLTDEEVFDRERERRIAELEAGLVEKDKKIRSLETLSNVRMSIIDNLAAASQEKEKIIIESRTECVVKDDTIKGLKDKVAELGAELEVVKAKLEECEQI